MREFKLYWREVCELCSGGESRLPYSQLTIALLERIGGLLN
jgi:hypothetical protein